MWCSSASHTYTDRDRQTGRQAGRQARARIYIYIYIWAKRKVINSYEYCSIHVIDMQLFVIDVRIIIIIIIIIIFYLVYPNLRVIFQKQLSIYL